MQLNIKIFFVYFLILAAINYGQEKNENSNTTEVDFLVSYYEQDGNNAAVTGGIGTEELNDIATQIVINVPMNNGNKLSISGGFDSYSSASSDQIDPISTGASGQDARVHINGAYTFISDVTNSQYGFNLGLSKEYDYSSISLGGSWAKSSEDGNSEINLAGQFFYDGVTLIYPMELRSLTTNPANYDFSNNSENRLTYSFSATYSQVLTKKLQASLNLDFVYQSGFLSTSFHRVYFEDESLSRIESLPNSRYKIPLGLRLNYYVSDFLITRLHYRYYHDDFGIDASTFSLELPLKLSETLTFSPFYRYHTQTAADYFVEFNKVSSADEFYTSDYDLSKFESHKYGLGIRYYPLFGITDFSPPLLSNSITLKSLNLRAGYYERSTGLNAFNVSLGFSFEVR